LIGYEEHDVVIKEKLIRLELKEDDAAIKEKFIRQKTIDYEEDDAGIKEKLIRLQGLCGPEIIKR
jgi:hypothetical protein